jgi:peptidoglycan/LPS O-acetylase OafA/YrhL
VAATVAYHLGHLRGGFLGVDVFFVLSGFLVTSLLLAEARGGRGVDLRSFWLARLRRLAPAVFVVVPTVLVGAWLVRWPSSRLDELAVDGAATLTWWQNWHQIVAGQSYWDPSPSPFRHAWSLAIEEQYYVLWPLAVTVLVAWTIRRSRSGTRTVGAVAGLLAVAGAGWHVALAHRIPVADLSRVYLGTDTRVVALLVGCALGCSRWGVVGASTTAGPSRALRGASFVAGGALLVLGATVHVSDPQFFRAGGFVIVALLAAVVVAHQAAVMSDAPGPGVAPAVRDQLRAGPRRLPGVVAAAVLSWLGRRSYGIYLWSWPIQVLAAHRWPDGSRWTRSVAVVAVSLAVAELSFRWLEHPLRHRSGWASSASRRRPAWATGALLSVVAVVAVHGAATPPPAHERLETADALDLASEPPTTAVPGASPGLGVLVLGDSVSFTVGLYKPNPFNLPEGLAWIDSRAVIGCGLLAADGWEYPDEAGTFAAPSGGDCVIQAQVERLGLAQRPDVVVMFPGAWETFPVRSPEGEVIEARSPRMAEVLQATLVDRALAAHEAGGALAVVAWVCPGEGTPAERTDPDFITWVNGVFRSATEAARAQGADARYVEPGPESCTGGPTGEPTDARRVWMADSNHVLGQEQGERFWREWLAPLLVREFTSR